MTKPPLYTPGRRSMVFHRRRKPFAWNVVLMKMPGFFELSECVIKSPFRAHEDGVPWSVKYPSMLQLLGKL